MKVPRAKASNLISIANNGRKILKVSEQKLIEYINSNYPVPLHLLIENNINLTEYMFAISDKYIVPSCSDEDFQFMYEYVKYICSRVFFTVDGFNIKNTINSIFGSDTDAVSIYNYYLTSVIKNNIDKFDIDEVFNYYINNIYSIVEADQVVFVFKSIRDICSKCNSYRSYREKIVQGITKDLINDLSHFITINETTANDKIKFTTDLIEKIITISGLDRSNEKVQLCFDTIDKIKNKVENYGMLS